MPGYVAIPELAIRSNALCAYLHQRRVQTRQNAVAWRRPRLPWCAISPLAVDGEPGTAGTIPALTLPSEVSAERFEQRAALLSLLDRGGRPETQAQQQIRTQAIALTGSSKRGRLQVLSLDDEPASVRDRYGRHRFGQTMLLARRLAEAGVPMVAVHFKRDDDLRWLGHAQQEV